MNRLSRLFAALAVILPLAGVSATDFQGRHLAVLEGEKAVAAMLPEIRTKLAKLREAPRL